jgi:hypothetical protein
VNLHRTAALALVLLAACGPDMTAINAASERAEADATRAERAAAAADADANRALNSCNEINTTIIKVRRSAERITHYVDRFAIWKTMGEPALHRVQSVPKLETEYGLITVTSSDPLAPPDLWDEGAPRDPRDREDDDHAEVVMACHPELDRLPGYAGKCVSADLMGSGKTKDGRESTVILITIDDTDPKNGAAILKQAREMAPALVDDVPVQLIGVSEWKFEAL